MLNAKCLKELTQEKKIYFFNAYKIMLEMFSEEVGLYRFYKENSHHIAF